MSSSFSSPADYLTVPHSLTPSFHFRTGKVPRLPVAERPSKVANQFGYPRPGIQSPTPALATAAHYFVDNNTWDAILDHGDFDDIVVGSGFCALAYVDEALKRDPWRKILILERGGMSILPYLCPSGFLIPIQASGFQRTSKIYLFRSRWCWGARLRRFLGHSHP